MKETLQKRCDLLVLNRKHMKENFFWENAYLYPLCASIYTAENKEINGVRLKEAKGILKANAGIFSNMRGATMMAIATKVSLDPQPSYKMEKVMELYHMLKKEFFSSLYLPLSAVMIYEMSTEDRYTEVVNKARRIYDLMKQEHPFLTSREDVTYAVLLALSEKSEIESTMEMERCYHILKGEFFSSNAVQSLSHALALGEEDATSKCSRTMSIFHRLKSSGYKYGTGYELATLGVLALANADIQEIVKDIIDVNEYLKNKKGFGAWSLGTRQRLMYASGIVMNEYVDQGKNHTMSAAAMNSVTAMIIAQQASMAAVAASSAAASSASSGGA